ncbi:MAG TPA: DNA translocase FtsK, partial [Fimbriimonadaceae bacterium]|nr:DNA translocase FtsK [Fimbriimonadaceae bacterium]
SWATALLFASLGIAALKGRRQIALTHLTWGLVLFYVALLGMLAQPVGGDYFVESAIPSGGYLGAIIGFGFAALLGSAKVLGLAAIALVGFILCVDVPIRDMLGSAKNKASDITQRTLTKRPPSEKRTEALARRAVVEVDEPTPTQGPQTEMAAGSPAKEKRKPIFTDLTSKSNGITLDSSTQKEGYALPPMSLLKDPVSRPKRSPAEVQANIETLEGTLDEFGIEANVVEIATGPTITRYEIQLGPGIKVARIVALADNIAMNLAAHAVRVEAPIPGKAAIGVEVPNSQPTPVMLKEVCDTKEFRDNPSRLLVALGQDVAGQNKYADLSRMPHLLIGGATNSGKSIGLATLITSLLMRNTPKDVRLVMIDPKRVELTLFDGIPHLMCPVIKDVKEAPGVLRAVWREMDRRYDLLSENGVRNIQSWNEKATFQDRLPYIVVIIDEMADLMIQARAEVETSIVRLAQLARAVGIHLVLATQRPSVDVITGIIKANIPSRVAFSVASQIDSRTILDQKGAEDLIGKGDMLFMPIDADKAMRVQGCYVSEKEIEEICKFWRAQETPQYVLEPLDDAHDAKKESGDFGDEGADPLWEESVRWVVDRGQASTSMLQRRFSIGFQRASRLLDTMEQRGVVGPRDGPRPREVLLSAMEIDDFLRGKSSTSYETGWVEDDENQ